MKEAVIKLLVNALIGYAIFVSIGFATVDCVSRWGYWRGILIGPALILAALYGIQAVNVLIRRRRESLSYLLRQYGETVAQIARSRRGGTRRNR